MAAGVPLPALSHGGFRDQSMSPHPPYRPGARPPRAERLIALFDRVAVVLTVLSILLLLMFAYGSLPAAGQQLPGPWAPLFWAATWVALALCGLSGLVPRGLVLCMHPELIVRRMGFSVVRRWPRRMGAACLWAAAGVVASAVPPLTQLTAVAQGATPHIDFVTWALLAVLAFVPGYALVLASLLVPLAPRQ